MPKFISIDKTGVAKSHNVEADYPLLDLYRRVGFKSPESFDQQYVWKTRGYRIVLLAKTKGRNGQSNPYPLPFAWDSMPVFYGSIALLNIDEDGTYRDLDLNEWNSLRSDNEIRGNNNDTDICEKEKDNNKDDTETRVEEEEEEAEEEPQRIEIQEMPKPLAKPRTARTKQVVEEPIAEPVENTYVQELEEEAYNTTETILDTKIYNTLSVPVVEFRSNVCSKLAAILPGEMLPINIEKGVYNYAINEAKLNSIVRKWDNPSFMQLYKDRLRAIFININTQPEFAARIKSGELDVETVAYMTHQEMHPARWKESIERKIKRDDSKFNAKVEASTDMFVCRNYKCKSKRCTYYEMQTRSADESATVFITCLDCGKHWKM
jgi:DNA-directed RNA polymerase subunit M/transcription elongation factor TFIIS